MVNPRLVTGTVGGIAAAVALILPSIQRDEGYVPHPYRDVVGVLTVCYGHTGPDIQIRTYTNKECKVLLYDDVVKFATGVVKITPSIENRVYTLAATISFAYNIGLTKYADSSIAKEFNAGHYKQGCTNMLKYTYAKGKYIQGLANRRQGEYALCMKGT